VRPIYRTGTLLPSKHPILYIFSTIIRTEFFKHAAHSLFFPLQNAIYFIMLPFFGSCIIRILHTVEPRFTNAPVHEQIFRAKNVSDDERCLGLRTRSWQQRQAESIGAGVSVAG
jgi:hypothetical protein